MRLLSIAVITLVVAAPLFGAARVRTPRESRNVPTPAAPRNGLRAELLQDLDNAQKKLISLAAAMPADRYSWRPAAGVRSVSEVYMHIAGGNYTLVSFVGDRPMLDAGSLERITEKARVMDELRRSFDFLRNAILKASDADLDKPIRMFGNGGTQRAAFLMALNHIHEHLGQSVAYARMNGVVPPWSTE